MHFKNCDFNGEVAMIYITYSNENQTFDAINGSGRCLFYSESIEEMDNWIDEQKLEKVDELTYK